MTHDYHAAFDDEFMCGYRNAAVAAGMGWGTAMRVWKETRARRSAAALRGLTGASPPWVQQQSYADLIAKLKLQQQAAAQQAYAGKPQQAPDTWGQAVNTLGSIGKLLGGP